MSKPNLTHFKFKNFNLVPTGTPESFQHWSFSVHKLDVVAKFKNRYDEEMPEVSTIMFFAAANMIRGEMVPAVVELVKILNHYDTKAAINWENTLSVVEFQLMKLHYKPDFIASTMEQLREAVNQELVEVTQD